MRSFGVALLAAASACLLSARSSAQTADVDRVPALQLVEEARIGSASDPALGFSSAFGTIAIDRDGQIFAYEPQDYQIRVYSPAGKLLRTIGRRGQGPGEFSGGPRFGVVGDTVWTIENRGATQALTLFDRTGRVLYTGSTGEVTVPLYMQVGVVRPNAMRSDGKFVGDMGLFRTARGLPPSDVKQTDTVSYPRILFDATATAALDTLGWDKRYPPESPAEYVAVETSARHPLPRASSDQPLTVVSPDWRVIVRRDRASAPATTTFHVARVTQTGDTLYSRAYAYTPHRFTPTLLDTLASRSAEYPGGVTLVIRDGVQSVPPKFANRSAAQALIRSKMQFPAFQAPIEQAFMGNDGSVWLRREDDASTTGHWLLLDPQGSPRGRIDIPTSVHLSWTRGDTVWAFAPDADDIPFLVRYRIARVPD